MHDYTELSNGCIRRERDGVIFPSAAENTDYQEFLHWQAAGGQIAPYAPPAVDPKEQAKADLRESDSDMARIAEDLISVMLSKGLIAESDIPQPARDKLAKRSELRSKLK